MNGIEKDPTQNVRELVSLEVQRLDDLREREVKRIDERITAGDIKNQIQFIAAKEAVGIALIAQEKAVAAALEGTREAINKADATTDKRFDLLSEKIDGIAETISKSSGERGIYVTHTDLNQSLNKLQANIEEALRPLIAYMNSSQGKSGGYNQGWIYLIGAVSLIGMIISITHALMEV